jgi:hypothetical protein
MMQILPLGENAAKTTEELFFGLAIKDIQASCRSF